MYWLEQLLLYEALLRHQLLQLHQGVVAHVNRLFLVAVLVKGVEHRRVVGHKVEPKPNVGVSVTMPKDELSNLRQLVQASAAAGANLPLVLLGLLALEALRSHEIVDLLQVVAAKIQPLLLLSVLVEEDKVRIVMRDEVHLQPNVGISVAGLLDEAPCLRELIQASAGAALDFSAPSSSDGSDFAFVLCGLQSHVEELNQVIGLPIFHVCTQNSSGPVIGF